MAGAIGPSGADGTVMAFSSPVGNCVVLWQVANAREPAKVTSPDGCGVAPLQAGRFMVTTGLGDVLQTRAMDGDEAKVLQHQPGVAKDNRLFALRT